MFKDDKRIIKSYAQEMNADNYQIILSKIYNYVKSITEYYYYDDSLHTLYSNLIDTVF